MNERRDGLYGRRKGKPLSPRRAGLMANDFQRLAIDVDEPPPVDVATLFAHRPARVCLEIGFGGGEHLVAAATADPDAGFIGVEPYLNGMANAVAAIHDAGLGNVRLFDGEASRLLDWLPPASLASVDLLYPDPWPKKRHWKRRFVSDENLDRLARVVQSGGTFRFASDIPSYVEWTLGHVLRHPIVCMDGGARRRLAVAVSGLAGHALRGQGGCRRPQADLPRVQPALSHTARHALRFAGRRIISAPSNLKRSVSLESGPCRTRSFLLPEAARWRDVLVGSRQRTAHHYRDGC